MKFRALIFDFDGTIADTLDEVLKLYNQMSDEFQLRPISEEELPALRKLTLSELLEHLEISKLAVPKILYKGTRTLKKSIPHLPLIEDMDTALKQLRKSIEYMGILTSNSEENAQLFLKTHNIEDLFDFVLSTSKLTGKSRYLKNVLSKYELEPQDAIYIGDEVRDIKSAKKAGIPIAAVTFGFNSKEALEKESPDYLCDTPAELVKILS